MERSSYPGMVMMMVVAVAGIAMIPLDQVAFAELFLRRNFLRQRKPSKSVHQGHPGFHCPGFKLGYPGVRTPWVSACTLQERRGPVAKGRLKIRFPIGLT